MRAGLVRTACLLPARIPETKDGALRLKLAVPVSKRLYRRSHDIVFLSQEGRMIGLPRTWHPHLRSDRFRPARSRTGPVPCTNCGKAANLDPRKDGEVMAFRCFWCLRVYCFGCSARHFGAPKKHKRRVFGRRFEITCKNR